ncbi:MAG: CPBP family intramembrane metalloprotease [Anaerolineales bacterium]|nr:CPBP family intramembrane metalloprotease [Anaerolineales bacterium]
MKNRSQQLDWPLINFFLLAYGLAWGVLGLFALIAPANGAESGLALLQAGEQYQFAGLTLTMAPFLLYLLTRLADFAFSIAGVVMIGWTTGRSGLRDLWRRLTLWRLSPWWYLAALLPLALYGVALLLAAPGAPATLDGARLTRLLFSLEAGFLVSLFLRGAMGEELGLRGFALPRLQARYGPVRASLILGVLWGFWHLPVLLGREPVTIVAFLLLNIGLSFVFTWLYNGSGGSLIPGLLFHATQNWEEGFETLFPALTGTDWELPSTLLLLLLGLVAIYLVRRQARRETPAPVTVAQTS